jgi:hypothetical protein
LHTLLWIAALNPLDGITGTNARMNELLAFMSTGKLGSQDLEKFSVTSFYPSPTTNIRPQVVLS